MSAKNILTVKHTKEYRKMYEYRFIIRRLRSSASEFFISFFAIAVPFLYFTASLWAERYFYPKWSFETDFYIFILGIVISSVIIPLIFKILKCSFTYWKLFLGIALSLALGYIVSLFVFNTMDFENDGILSSKIIFSIQTIVCTVFAVIGVNDNMWKFIKNYAQKKKFIQAYRRFEEAVNSDPADILGVYALAQSDYQFAISYLNKKESLSLLYDVAKSGFSCGKISFDEYERLLGVAAAGGMAEAASECADYYISLEESELITLNSDEKKTATAVLKTLENEVKEREENGNSNGSDISETSEDLNMLYKNLYTILQARLRSSMILYEADDEKYVDQLLESISSLREIIENGSCGEKLLKAAKRAYELSESTMYITLRNKK